jgi:hypothetical protein
VKEKMENWSIKSIDEVGSVRKTSSAYRTQKFGIKKKNAASHPSYRWSRSTTIKNWLVGGESMNLLSPSPAIFYSKFIYLKKMA